MIRYQSKEQKEKFKELCTLVDFKYEYPGYDGDIRYGFYSALPEHCQNAMFGDILAQISPYMKLDKDYVEARGIYMKNEKKFQYRNAVGNQFSTDDDFEEHHPEAVTESFEDEFILSEQIETLRSAFSVLTEIQRLRVKKVYFEGKTYREIAAEEGVDHKTVVESVQLALKKMIKFFD